MNLETRLFLHWLKGRRFRADDAFRRRKLQSLQRSNTGHIRGYIDAQRTVAAASGASMSVGEYVESQWGEVGKAKQVISRALEFIPRNPTFAIEIGPGTGRFAEELVRQAPTVTSMHFFEPDSGWTEYLKKQFRGVATCYPADGKTLAPIPSGSADICSAHGVFVYLPYSTTWTYLREIERCLRVGGVAYFDVYSDVGPKEVKYWAESDILWPITYSDRLVKEAISYTSSLVIVGQFKASHAGLESTYFVVKKVS